MRERRRIAGHEVELERLPGAAPDAPTLVLLHEALGCLDLWRGFPARLAEATGWAVVAWSRWGYGRSEPRPRPWPFDYHEREAVDALPDLLDQLGVGPHVLWGHSDGATIALLNAALAPAPELLGVVSVAGHVVVEDAAPGAMDAVLARYESGDLRERLGRHHDDVDAVFGEWMRIWTDPSFADWDIRPDLAAVAVPTLVAQGIDDEYATPAHVGLIVDAVGDGAEPLLIEACGHQPMFEAPDEVIGATARFLGGLVPAR